MASWHDALAIYAVNVLAAVNDVNEEHRMSVQVTGLADTVRRAKAAIDAAGGAAARLESSANAVVNTIGAVDDMTKQLDAANADLQAAVGVMTNGGPPLVASPAPAPTSPPVVTLSLGTQVQASPPAVTASTIAAERAAEAAALIAADIPSSIIAVQNANASVS